MTAKVAVQAEKGFNRNLEGQMVTGHPKHPDVHGRFLLLSATAAAALVERGDAKTITRAAYDKAIRDADGVEEERESAGDVRTLRTEAAGGGTNTGGGKPRVRARVTMSNEMLDGLAEDAGVDVSKAKSRSEKVKLINGDKVSGDGKSDVQTPGVVGNLTEGSTNHPDASSPHKGTNARGSVVDEVRVPGDGGGATGEGGAGVDAEEDAAPRGGGDGGGA